MESQMADTHGVRYEHDPDNVGLHAADGDQEEHYQEKKSVLKKVKDKAKKLKDTLKVYGHGHGHDDHHEDHDPDDHDLDEEDDEDEEMVEDPEDHGASAIRSPDTKGNYGSSTAMQEEEEAPLKVVTGKTSIIKEAPHAPANSPASISPAIVEQPKVTDPIRGLVHEQGASRGQPEVKLEVPTGLAEDPHAPKDGPGDFNPSNYQTKVADPTGSGGEEAGVSSILQSFDKMKIHDESKQGEKQNLPTRQCDQLSMLSTGSHDQFSPEPTPPISISTLQENPQSIPEFVNTSVPQEHQRSSDADELSNQSSYTGKISAATSAIAEKAKSATNVVASKLGYGEKDNTRQATATQGGQDTIKPASPAEYGKKIAATVTQTLAPVYEKVTGVGSTVISKVHGTTSSSTNTVSEGESNIKGQDKGLSVRDYFAEKLRPGDEDRALSEVITEVLNKKKAEEENEGRPMEKVTESEEVKRRLGNTEDNSGERLESDSVQIPGKAVVDKLKGAVGSLFAKGEESRASQQQQPLSSSNAGTEEFSTYASGEGLAERRLQESGD